MRAIVIAGCLLGCHAKPVDPERRPPAAPAAAPAAAPTPAPAPGPALAPNPRGDAATALTIAPTGPFALPVAYTRCASDADCTYATLGCCEVTPVNQASRAIVADALERSGRRECPPKAACGPGPRGTWDGQPGRCVARVCGAPGK